MFENNLLMCDWQLFKNNFHIQLSWNTSSVSTDAFIEKQVWKAHFDLSIFQDLMAECGEVEAVSKTRYVKVKQNSCTADSGELEKCESEEATGGETTTDETVEEPIFLETTV